MKPKKQTMVFILLLVSLMFFALPALAAPHDSSHYPDDGYVRGGSLNLRLSCSTTSTIIGYIANNTCIRIQDEGFSGSTKMYFVTALSTASGEPIPREREGWVVASYVTPICQMGK